MVGLFSHPKRRLKKLIKDGEYLEAIQFGKNFESKYSDDSDFMFIMGSIYYILEDGKKALPYFERAHQLNRTDIETLTLKTNSHLSLQQKDEAIECCRKILEIQPDNAEAQDLLEKLEEI